MAAAVEHLSRAFALLLDAGAALSTDVAKYIKYPVPMLTTAARTSYPWPLQLGTELSAIITFRRERDARPTRDQPGWLYSIAVSFVLYAMAGNVVTNWIFFARTPTVFVHSTIIPVHVACWALIQLCPGDVAYRVLSAPLPYFLLDTLGLIDGYTTAFNVMEEAHAASGGKAAVFPIMAGVSVMLAGAVCRHFLHKGVVRGAAELDDKMAVPMAIVAGAMAYYYYHAIVPCGEDAACLAGTGLYEGLTLLAVAHAVGSEALALTKGPEKKGKQKAS